MRDYSPSPIRARVLRRLSLVLYQRLVAPIGWLGQDADSDGTRLHELARGLDRLPLVKRTNSSTNQHPFF